MKCYNKECNNHEEGRDTTDCIILYPNEVVNCIEFIDKETYNQVNSIETIKEICEWVYMYGYNRLYSTCREDKSMSYNKNAVKGFNVCPYCEKPIRIKGE